jgi:hypothetical protein
MLIIVKSDHKEVFGGYADVAWNRNSDFVKGNGKSFLFSLTKGTKHPCVNKEKELYFRHNCGVIFGGGFDLLLFNQQNN